jgi:hypothetical protein
MKSFSKQLGRVLIGFLLFSSTGCSEVSMRGEFNHGIKQLFISQAGLCNNKVLITNGKVDSSSSSDGWSMIDTRTDQLVRVSGDAIILDATKQQIDIYLNADSNQSAQAKLNDMVQRDGTIMRQPDDCTLAITKTK